MERSTRTKATKQVRNTRAVGKLQFHWDDREFPEFVPELPFMYIWEEQPDYSVTIYSVKIQTGELRHSTNYKSTRGLFQPSDQGMEQQRQSSLWSLLTMQEEKG